jgi:hypothetical protein
MHNHLGTLARLASVALALGLSECGGKSASQNVQIQILPTNPIVFTSALTYNNLSGTPVTVGAPWMRLQVIINNQSNQSVTIEGITLTITDNNNPQGQPTVVSFSPATDNYTTNNDTCTFSDYGQFDPGGGEFSVPPPTPSTALTQSFNDMPLYEIPSGTSGCAIVIPTIVAGSLPTNNANTTGPQVQQPSYSVQLQPIGWFGTRTNQVNRFTNYAYFTTQ